MANFQGMQLTRQGSALMTKLLRHEGGNLQTVLTRVALGSGILPEGQRLQGLTALISEHTSLPITTKTIVGTEVIQLETRFNSTQFPVAVRLHEIGVFANDPDLGEILYAVDNATDGDTIPAAGGGTFVNRVFRILIQVADAANVSFTVDGDLTSYRLDRTEEVIISAEGQREFSLTAVNSKGAILVFVEGAVDTGWTTPNGQNKIALSYALPAGKQVVFSEVVLREN